jgi:hypothetical protein
LVDLSLKSKYSLITIDEQSFLSLADALNQLQSLETLNISNNSLTNVGLKILCSTLEKNYSLRYLNLNFNEFNDYSSIGKLLQVNSTLERLEIISNNSIELNGFIQFSKSLQSTSLTQLSLSKISTELVPYICSILENNSSLKSLQLELNESVKMQSLFNSLAFNKSLESFENIGRNSFHSKKIEDSLKFNYTLKEYISKTIGRSLIIMNLAQRKKFNHYRRFVTHYYKPVINMKTWDVQFHWK